MKFGLVDSDFSEEEVEEIIPPTSPELTPIKQPSSSLRNKPTPRRHPAAPQIDDLYGILPYGELKVRWSRLSPLQLKNNAPKTPQSGERWFPPAVKTYTPDEAEAYRAAPVYLYNADLDDSDQSVDEYWSISEESESDYEYEQVRKPGAFGLRSKDKTQKPKPPVSPTMKKSVLGSPKLFKTPLNTSINRPEERIELAQSTRKPRQKSEHHLDVASLSFGLESSWPANKTILRWERYFEDQRQAGKTYTKFITTSQSKLAEPEGFNNKEALSSLSNKITDQIKALNVNDDVIKSITDAALKSAQDQERIEKERLKKEKVEKEMAEKERVEKEKAEHERLEKEKVEKENEKKRLEQERVEKEKADRVKLENERLERQSVAASKLVESAVELAGELPDDSDTESKPSAKPQTGQTPDAAAKSVYDKFATYLQEQRTNVFEVVKATPAQKKICDKARRALKTRVSQINSSKTDLLRVITNVDKTLNDLRNDDSAYKYCMNTLAKLTINQVETMVGIKLESCFSLAVFVLGVITKGHSAFGEILMSRLIKRCVWISGYLPSHGNETLAEYMKIIGYRMPPFSQKIEETTEQNHIRQASIVAFYAAILQTDPTKDLPFLCSKEELSHIIPEFRLSRAWTWTVTMLQNSKAKAFDHWVDLLGVFIVTAGHSIVGVYGKQAHKLLLCILKEGVENKKISTSSKGSVGLERLKTFLDKWKNNAPLVPDGRDLVE